jgi:threonine/homoserine/homoserine lactone efflux protein
MTLELFIGLFTFSAIAAFTPGPNNALLMASGMNHGFRQTWPMMLGVTIGFPTMIGLIGLGLGRVFDVYPMLYTLLKFAGAGYMLFLAFKIATASPADGANTQGSKPLSFFQMCLFQWVNPKGWVMAVTALSSYTLASNYHAGVAMVVGVFMFMGLTSALTWASFGAGLKSVMSAPRYFRAINISLAVLLVASLVPMLRH